jgi:hypothetical protein
MSGRVSAQEPAPTSSYPSLESFYRADPRRVSSREQDVGLWWREELDGPLHRAAWIADTGELYLARLGPDPQDAGERVEVLAREGDRERVALLLDGWRDHCGEPGSLAWLRERGARLGAHRPARARSAPGRTVRSARLAPAARLAMH